MIVDRTQAFEEHRGHLRAVAYRMLGSLSEADDAVQETWLRYDRADTTDVANLGGWLTTVAGRVCLDLLRSRTSRREDSLDDRLPDFLIGDADAADPEGEAVAADSVGVAMLIVLDTLSPAERLAFVLHDMFAVSFEDIAGVIGREPAATRQLASRARRRVRDAAPVPDPDPRARGRVVRAFLSAARDGDFDALVALLDPDVVLRADGGRGALDVIRGAAAVAGRALSFRAIAHLARPVLVNDTLGTVSMPDGRAASVMSLTVSGGRITEINIIFDADRVAALS